MIALPQKKQIQERVTISQSPTRVEVRKVSPININPENSKPLKNSKTPTEREVVDKDQEALEQVLRQKIYETNKKINQLMKCETEYIEQLKENQQTSEQDGVQEALIKAANSLVQAKIMLDTVPKYDPSKLNTTKLGIEQQMTNPSSTAANDMQISTPSRTFYLH